MFYEITKKFGKPICVALYAVFAALAAKKKPLPLLILLGLHTGEYFLKGRRIAQEQGLSPLTVFTHKECAMKLTGLGFSLPLQEIDTTKDFIWQNGTYRFFTMEQEGYCLSILTAEEALPQIQLLTPEELL